ncbi:restriction endonuclease subunit S [Salmonella enterica]|nr:restriction endonuclease subunit S [Salmonella enterica]EDT7063286.1 restriction endonuclease subunit S [Salmonella enterica subsp. enterica]EIP7679615.1 restriction endonuclease subunit S [Salmonella enterica subsp. enterica serovar Infantis]EDF5437274.1 restriction endonuclease subunit S [Salmonella enterica]EGK1664628.1 restriction endonuclease subunit S [Salmonella enterica]
MSEMSYLEKLLDGVEVEWLPLGKLGELVRGNGLPKSDFTESGVPAIHYGQIYTFYGLSTETTKSFVSHETAKKLKKVNSGDVVITNTSENFTDVGKALVYLGKEQAVTGGHATIFKPNSTIIGKYFAYFTQTDSFANEKRKYSKGTKVIDVSASDMAKIIIPIPCPDNPEKSLAIQSEIVRILDKFTALTAELTAELTMRKKQYNYYRDQLLSFDEGEVEWKTLGEVAVIGTGNHDTQDAIEHGKYIFYARGREPLKLNVFDFDETAIITAGDGAGVGKVFHYAKGKYALHQRAYRIVPNAFMNPRFVYHYITAYFFTYIQKASVSSSVTSLRRPMFLKFPIPVPPSEEQARIVEILDKFDTLTNSITEGLPREIELRQKQYEYYRDLLFSFPKPETVSN